MKMFGAAAAVRRVGDRAAVGRPARRDVQRLADGDAPLVLAVVVGDVDLLDAAALDRAAPCARRRGRSRTSASSARRRSARAATCGSRPRSCARTAAGSRAVVVLRADKTACRVRTLNSFISTWKPALAFCTVPTMRPSAFSSRQRSNGTSANDVAAGIERVDVARDERELALEVQVVPEHLADRLRGRRRVSASVDSAMKSGTASRGARAAFAA